ncbi:Cro/CI family transcriptional regulator [Chelatococcus sp. SYSU_G07232]|uniref:Cro/CI family transcriptional regulator n=1 Tax=Chelatococcus albus TaxID=3047466 RepID=A0ABT7AJS1_9HYPH|nr:Cro/CI family transcriptional regulator [Chelatococcus sp. SYSU_G07232]MDJ1159617.1 Cro/CI family transcriptional regulator [Chelatococcus sp. SYSU_G07232]
MRDAGLERAISAAGGVRSLARQLGVSQPAVSTWKRVPADRVLAVEALTGVARTTLRPDLYPPADPAGGLDSTDAARAAEYELIGTLLWRAPDAAVLTRLAKLRGDASELGVAHLALAEAAARTDADVVGREFFDLFVGLGRGELLPYASYYLTGFLHERPLARLRGDLALIGVERAERVAEPEDHIAILCEVMAGLIRGDFAAEGIDEKTFFTRHVEPWAARFFADLETARFARFYRPVGTIGRLLTTIEAEAFALPA